MSVAGKRVLVNCFDKTSVTMPMDALASMFTTDDAVMYAKIQKLELDLVSN